MPKEAKEPAKPAITFGPFEQALVVLFIMTFGTCPLSSTFSSPSATPRQVVSSGRWHIH